MHSKMNAVLSALGEPLSVGILRGAYPFDCAEAFKKRVGSLEADARDSGEIVAAREYAHVPEHLQSPARERKFCAESNNQLLCRIISCIFLSNNQLYYRQRRRKMREREESG